MKIQRQYKTVELDPNIKRGLMFSYTVFPVTCLKGAARFKLHRRLDGPHRRSRRRRWNQMFT